MNGYLLIKKVNPGCKYQNQMNAVRKSGKRSQILFYGGKNDVFGNCRDNAVTGRTIKATPQTT